MIEIREIKEIQIQIDEETEQKYIQTWYNDSRRLISEEMEELLIIELNLDVKVVKLKLVDRSYDNLSTYRIKYMEK